MSVVASDRASHLDIELGRESGIVAVVCHDVDALIFVLDQFPDDRKQQSEEIRERKLPCPTLRYRDVVASGWICLLRFEDSLCRARNIDAHHKVDVMSPIELHLDGTLGGLQPTEETDAEVTWLISLRQCKVPTMPDSLRDLFLYDAADRAIEAEAGELLTSLADLSGPGLDAIASQLAKNEAIRRHGLQIADLRERFFAVVEKEKARRAALEVERQAEQVKAAALKARETALSVVRNAFDLDGKVTFDRIIQFGRDEPSYRLFFKVGQQEQAVNVKSTEQLRSRTRMEAVLGGALRTCINPDYTQKGYHNVYRALLFLTKVIEVPSHDEQTASWIESFLRSEVKSREFEPREAVQHMAQLRAVDGEAEFDGKTFALRDGESFRATDGRVFLNRAEFVDFVRNKIKAERDERVINQRLAMIGFTQKGGKVQVKSGGKVYCRRFIVGRLADRE